MKKFIKNILEWQMWASLMFTASVIVYMIVAAILGETSLKLITLLSILCICIVGTALQYIFFTNNVVKKMKYSVRLMLFSILFLAFLTFCAYVFNWFPMKLSGWLLFVIIFIVVLLFMTAGFEIYFRLTGKRYDGLLGQYKLKTEEKSDK